MVRDKKQGWALFSAAAILFVIGMVVIAVATSMTPRHRDPRRRRSARRHRNPVRRARQCAVRSGRDRKRGRCSELVLDGFASAGGAMLMLNVIWEKWPPAAPVAACMALVMMALLAVFLGGLMIGRYAQYLTKRWVRGHRS